MRTTLRLLAAASALAFTLACGPQAPASKTARPGAGASSDASSASDPSEPSLSRDPSIASLDESEAMQVYYQFVDERGRVRFVPTLAEVPQEWRSRVGFVEMSSPPPGSPAEAHRLREKRTAHVTVPARATTAGGGRAMAGQVDVILYGADWCGACRMAKKYMDSKGVDYEERNVDEPRWAQEMRAKAGPGGIPVIDVGGQIMRGFSAERLDQLIAEQS
jgi:glutaredoxin